MILSSCSAILMAPPAPHILNTRSTFNILWSCLTTIFICTWTSIHPNIPPRKQGQFQASWRKITLMFWALILPELVLTWAVKQWLAARVIEKHFIGMSLSACPDLMIFLVIPRLQMDKDPCSLSWHGWLHPRQHSPIETVGNTPDSQFDNARSTADTRVDRRWAALG